MIGSSTAYIVILFRPSTTGPDHPIYRTLHTVLLNLDELKIVLFANLQLFISNDKDRTVYEGQSKITEPYFITF